MTPTTLPRPARTADDDDAFLVPAGGFFCDQITGAGHVHLPDDFYALDSARQLAILAGWRKGIDDSWRRALVQTFRREYGDETCALPERLERFRGDLAARGVEMPADFALALQRY